ncbi:MAG: O-antigen ligase family protein [Candidatus Portnoybacteria bacterium]
MINSNSKNLTILITEIAVVFLMVMGVVPPDAGLFLTGVLVFYFIFSPLKDSLWIFVASIPLFTVFPVVEGNSMANWRILLAVLFLVMFFRQGISNRPSHYLVEYLTGLFLLLGALSLFSATDIWIGVKKILFLVNIFLLFLIIRNLAVRDRKIIPSLISAAEVAIGITLSIGFIQYISVIFIRLFPFWQFWARSVIPVFYGQDLSNLLSYSNTWFSYYTSLPATLRMFSIFPDSHSFAFFCIMSLPFFLVRIFIGHRNKVRTSFQYFFLILCLLAIIFSGSRGAWVAALGSLLVALFALLIFKLNKNQKKQVFLIIGALLIFFLLFPISSRILLFYQQVQLNRPLDVGDASFFERARSIFDFDEISVKSRLEIWEKTIISISERPLLGVGVGNFPVVLEEKLSMSKKGSSAHSLYLDIFAEMGVLALLTLLAIIFYILKDTWQVFKKTEDTLGEYFPIWAGFFLLALVWIFGYSLFDVVLFNDKVLLFFMVNLGLLYSYKYVRE